MYVNCNPPPEKKTTKKQRQQQTNKEKRKYASLCLFLNTPFKNVLGPVNPTAEIRQSVLYHGHLLMFIQC